MRRWTDGKSWSASRVSGSFLTYREMEGKRGGTSFTAPRSNRDGLKGSEESADDGPDGYRYKPDGLMKQSFSITTSTGQHLHLISYFARVSAVAQNLQQPSNDAQLRHIRPEKGMYPESTVHEQNSIPAVTRGPMTSPAFAPSPHQSANLGTPTYAHRGPPHPHYQMAYAPGWAPPSPMHTPPPYSPYWGHAAHPQHQHPASIGHSPHPSHVGQSPLQHMHPAYPPHAQPYPPPPTVFDRAPAPLTTTTLPPPPPPANHMPPMPPIQNGHMTSAAPHPYSLPSVSTRPPAPTDHSSYRPSSSGGVIDPSLSGPSPQDARRPEPSRHSHHDSTSNAQSNPEDNSRPPPPPASSATTIPSISSLIHETSGSTPPVRTSSHSPNQSQPRHAQDIPMHKMGYDPARDVQALRYLDKATLRF